MDITLKNLQKKIPIPQALVNKAAGLALKNWDKCLHLSIVFVGTKRMRAVNKKFLNHDYVTDVITFDLGDGENEILICPAIAAANAKRHNTSIQKEIALYVIHGILHLAGFNDHSPREILAMRAMEKKLMLGLFKES